jgi:hypothetical protein
LKKKQPLRMSLSMILFLLSIFALIYSAQQTRYLRDLSLLFTIFSVGQLAWAIITISTFDSSTKGRQLLEALFHVMCLTLSFHSIIGLLQFFKKNTLGLLIETRGAVPIFGMGADEAKGYFRPIGLRDHANFFANDVLLLLFSVIVLFLFLRKDSRKEIKRYDYLFFFSCLLSTVVIITTVSRAAYLALFAFYFFAFFIYKTEVLRILKKLIKFASPYKFYLFIISFFLASIIAERSLYTIYSPSEAGGISLRILLQKESIDLIRKNVVWGVGQGMYIPAAFDNNRYGVMSYFPEAVHNGFLLLLAENGIVFAGLIFLAYFLLIRDVIRSTQFDTKLRLTYLIAFSCSLLPIKIRYLI